MAQNSLTAINKALDDIFKRLKDLDQLASGISSGAGGTSGGTSTGGGSVMPSSLGKFSSLAKYSGAAGNFLAGALGVAAGASSALPDVKLTMARESGIYGAGVASGGMVSRNAIESGTRLGLGKFMNIEGATGVVSGILAGRGMIPGSRTYNQTVTSVGQAARYLNMPNDVAAQAIEGLTSGPTSAMMMNSFGVFTSNPVTGQAMTQGQIFEQLAKRWTAGNKTTVAGTMESIRRGALGSNIRNSGLDSAQQALLSQYMIDRAGGINMDLSDPNAISKAIDRNQKMGIENPFLSGMELTSANDQMMNRATQPYIQGMKDATAGLIDLKKSLEGLPDSFYKTKAAVDTFIGDFTGAGVTAAAVAGVTGLFSTITSLIEGMMIAKGVKTIATAMRGGGGGKTTPKSSTGTPKGSGWGRSDAARAADAYTPKSGSNVGNVLKSFGKSAALSVGVSAAVSSVFEDVALVQNMNNPEWVKQQKKEIKKTQKDPWAAFGKWAKDPWNWVESILSLGMSGGPANAVRTGNMTVANGIAGNGPLRLVAPVNARVTAPFGDRSKVHPNGHKGTDFGVAEGTPVGAAGDGVVSRVQWTTGTGQIVEIDHGGGFSTLYAHLSQALVSVGTQVKQGNIIAKSGNTGTQTTGPHLHFEVRKNGTPINPAPYLGGSIALSAGNFGSAMSLSASSDLGGLLSTGAATASGLMSGMSGIDPTANAPHVKPPASYTGANYMAKSNNSTGNVGRSKSGSNSAEGTGGGYVPVAMPSGGTGGSGAVLEKSHGNHTNNVTINLSIQKATADEAKNFAKLVKEYMEEDTLLHKMGSK